jgi:hypothetical protein
MSESNITAYVNSHLRFSSRLIMSVSSVLILSLIFHLDCTRWCKFTRLTCIGKKLDERDYIIDVISPYMTEFVTVTSLSASLQRKTRATTGHVCQIALLWKLSRIIYAKLH